MPIQDTKTALIHALQLKKQQLVAGLDALIRFEQAQSVSLKLVGSVPLCEYWLDSDIDVYVDCKELEQKHDAWESLDIQPQFDLILYPNDRFKQRILMEGVSPSEAKIRLEDFDGEVDLIEAFPQRRYDKIIRTLDNSRYFVEKLENLQSFYSNHLALQASDKLSDPFMQRLAYGSDVGKVAFRLVWVGLMVLSGYEHLMNPKSHEIENQVRADDWRQWMALLKHPMANREVFDMPAGELVYDFYRHVEAGVFTHAFSVNAECDPITRLSQWLDGFQAFDLYTREWLNQYWSPLL